MNALFGFPYSIARRGCRNLLIIFVQDDSQRPSVRASVSPAFLTVSSRTHAVLDQVRRIPDEELADSVRDAIGREHSAATRRASSRFLSLVDRHKYISFHFAATARPAGRPAGRCGRPMRDGRDEGRRGAGAGSRARERGRSAVGVELRRFRGVSETKEGTIDANRPRRESSRRHRRNDGTRRAAASRCVDRPGGVSPSRGTHRLFFLPRCFVRLSAGRPA